MGKIICSYLLETDDSKSKKLLIDKIIIDNNFKDYEIHIYDLDDDISFSKILEDLDTYTLLNDRKVVVVSNINILKDDTSINNLSKYLKNPKEDTILILVTPKIDKKSKLFKEINDKVSIIDTNINTFDFVKESLKSYKILDSDIYFLIDYVSDNITKLTNEIEKLKAYKLDSMEINRDDIINIVIEKKEDKDKILFSLIDYIMKKDIKNATNTLKNIDEFDTTSIIGLLDSQLRIFIQTIILKEEGLNKDAIATKLNIHPNRIQKVLENIKNYNKEDIERLILELSSLDYNIKSGKTDQKIALDMYILNLKRE